MLILLGELIVSITVEFILFSLPAFFFYLRTLDAQDDSDEDEEDAAPKKKVLYSRKKTVGCAAGCTAAGSSEAHNAS